MAGAGQELFAALLDGRPAGPEHRGVVVEGLGQRALGGHLLGDGNVRATNQAGPNDPQ